ncbi:MAG TPA: sugar ABC transporter permease [Dongiaceae bacterium]|jgi:ABC-type sugar transport system permease subunit|nr:sugar ABC transporter permease [Dongiaceae bacterium]
MTDAVMTEGGRNAAGRLRLSPAEHRRLARKARLRRELTGWMFLGPMFLCFVLFLVVPVCGTVWWSLRTGNIASGTSFVGLQNFYDLPGVVGAGSAIANTLIFAAISVPLILVGALGVALILAKIRHGGSIYRFLVYFPVLVPGVVAALIWLFLTNVDFGLFNNVMKAFGAYPVTWLGADSALGVLAVLDVWRNIGYWAMFFVAAIIGLPTELYQAAELDGASTWARFRYLTLPLLRRIIFFAVIVSTIWGLQVFDTALVLTNGGPGTATTTVIYRVWLYVFASNNKVGFASAISLVLILVILALTLVQMRLLRDRRGID